MESGLLLALYPRKELAKDAGVSNSCDRPWGIYSGYFRDPDGHLWEIIWNRKAATGVSPE